MNKKLSKLTQDQLDSLIYMYVQIAREHSLP